MKKVGKSEKELWNWVQANTAKLADNGPKDLIAYECLANDPLYAKPDIEKSFILWRVPLTLKGIKVTKCENFALDHPELAKTFVTSDSVHFPFNVADSEIGGDKSLSWYDAIYGAKASMEFIQQYRLPRWSTASRSCYALIPASLDALESLSNESANDLFTEEGVFANRFEFKIPGMEIGKDKGALHAGEWKKMQAAARDWTVGRRMYTIVKDYGDAASKSGIKVNGVKHRLYSVKTGISYVGSKSEIGAHKNRLEANSTMAMLRSQLMTKLKNGDDSLGIQTEVLTVTAIALNEKGKTVDDNGNQIRDGFQVRDLSCMKSGLAYVPGQAIPYVRNNFDGGFTSPEVLSIQRRLKLQNPTGLVGDVLSTKDLDPESVAKTEAEGHVTHWCKNFTYPLGRAKARLFLNYGLIHTSANAQNFVLGFKGSKLSQFVLRDVGDTSWHDDYIKDYAKGTPVEAAFGTESKDRIKHVLKETSSGDYPAPYTIRLAAWSLLTHGFGDRMNWTNPQLYKFVTAVFDGFHDFVVEAMDVTVLTDLASKIKVKAKAVDVADDIKTYGTHCRYPYDQPKLKTKAYQQNLDVCLKSRGEDLLARAKAVRLAGIKAMNGSGTKYEMQDLVAAEETLLCAAVQRLLLNDQAMDDMKTHRKTISKRITSGVWPKIVV